MDKRWWEAVEEKAVVKEHQLSQGFSESMRRRFKSVDACQDIRVRSAAVLLGKDIWLFSQVMSLFHRTSHKAGTLLPCLLTSPGLQHSCSAFMRLSVMFCAVVLLLSCPVTRGELSWFKGGVAAFMEFLLTYRKMSLNGINFLLLNAVKKNIREISSALVYYIINKVIIKISTIALQSYLNYHSYLLYLAWE